ALLFSNAFSSEKMSLFEITSDEFFMKHAEFAGMQRIDVALVDGLHTYAQSLSDVEHCLEFLKPRGVIVMHDCNPETEDIGRTANSQDEALKLNYPNQGRTWCGDVWRAVVHLRSLRADLRVFVVDCDYGIGIVTPGKAESMLPYSLEQIRSMTYPEFSAKRTLHLNLKDTGSFDSFLETMG
ncbi:MAG: class I SAM-dependent methyltransferase, partial [candidate division NC10 bacterium]